MSSKEILNKLKLRHSSYWERPYTQWGINTWELFYSEAYPEVTSKRKLRNDFGGELDVLVRNLEPGTRESKKVLALKRKLEVSAFTCSQKCGSVNENSEYATPRPIELGEEERPAVKSKSTNKENVAPPVDRLTESELFRVVLLIPRLLSITTNNTTTSASSRAPENPVKSWNTFLADAFSASLLISADRKFNSPEIIRPTASIESTTIKLFLRAMEQINNQRLKCLLKPARWDTRAQCRNTFGEPDVILFGANNNELLHSIIDTKLLAVAEVKPEQLMTNLIKGTKLYKGKVEITDEREELFDLYNSAVDMVDYGTNDYTKYEKIIKIVQQAFGYMVVNNLRYGIITSYVRTWFLKRDQDNANIIYISPMVPINQQHIENQASFLECVRYFEDISSIKTNAYSLPPKPDHGNYQDLDSSNSDQSDHDSSDDYKLKSKRKKVNNLEVNTRITRSKSAQTTTTWSKRKATMKEKTLK
ncbi:hypothetical protein Glove_345g71 [Diversispora epigaea]|uniref:Uncharacterized protein n=1 Tax=Diversispora epigaea TaxID=1348612 RepID=A0A397HIC3_9GLOM|nr:hypothetical protein Glove_345g71 [Diversispora epigaea]